MKLLNFKYYVEKISKNIGYFEIILFSYFLKGSPAFILILFRFAHQG